MEYELITLSNGIRVVFKAANFPVAHACVLINVGTRDEPKEKEGLAHFIEHLIFKKTARRNTTQILNYLELVGADLNAYTTKEYTCLHASILNEHLNKAMDLFEDILFHSQFPEQEISKEKSVILDEIASYKDSPEEAIQDDFEDLLFADHQLGHNILGTPETLKKLEKQDIIQFIATHYVPENIVIGITANKSSKQIKKLVEQYFGGIQQKPSLNKRTPPIKNGATHKVEEKTINQVHYMLGGQAYDYHHPLKTALLLTNNVLGGTGMSSRLNLEIREKYGMAYTIESQYTPLSDTGIFSLYFGTDSENLKKTKQLLFKELKKLRDKKLGPIQLQQAKRKYIGQIALGEENRMALIISLSKAVMDYGYAESLPLYVSKINAVTSAQIQEVANEIFSLDNLSSLLFLPNGS